MVKLFCAIVGVAGTTFPVDIDANKTVGGLKKAIKNESDGIITCPWPLLELFLAKKGDGWLPSNELATVQGEEAKTPMGFERVPMTDAAWVIQDVLTQKCQTLNRGKFTCWWWFRVMFALTLVELLPEH
ncbi:Crinkler (CRN) [Phytophthora megakarya]|uniref:Crinkler (CRN) n=1 Tax=Phytophthora megakarya TaxID=4795 RepID=A0A225UG75_9STRA|nr:Crinkler (CRN) [Phytophthora megakarya]